MAKFCSLQTAAKELDSLKSMKFAIQRVKKEKSCEKFTRLSKQTACGMN